jgi:hypothetical protein
LLLTNSFLYGYIDQNELDISTKIFLFKEANKDISKPIENWSECDQNLSKWSYDKENVIFTCDKTDLANEFAQADAYKLYAVLYTWLDNNGIYEPNKKITSIIWYDGKMTIKDGKIDQSDYDCIDDNKNIFKDDNKKTELLNYFQILRAEAKD